MADHTESTRSDPGTPNRDKNTDADRLGTVEIGKRAMDINTVKPPTGDFKQVDTD